MRLFLVFVITSLLLACSNSVGPETPDEMRVELKQDSLPGMLRVKTSNASVVLGTNAPLSLNREHPALTVKIDYDFSLGRHEVTCAEFNEIMVPATGLELECENDDLPATNVTYYDAVLYSNEMSKAIGLDTVYSYTDVSFDDLHHCVGIEGFVFHPEVDAFRLPTEAEWVLVANKNWNTKKGWLAENSDYKLHKVCSLEKHENVPCDMVGNAMEWSNDWLGQFLDTTVVNYVGAPDGGSLGERVIKGGSYQTTQKNLFIFSRGDVYAVTSSTRAAYVGFRLGFGSIPEATWIDYKGNTIVSRALPLLNTASIRKYTNTYKMRLAFRNNISGNLSLLDYSSGVLYISEIADTMPVYHPEISPDGQFVAFCTGLEGVSGKSQIYVRSLDLEKGNIVKLDVESAAIPRWRVLENGDTVIVYVTDAGNNKENSTFAKMETWQVPFRKGSFRKPKKLFDGAYHGGISTDRRLTVTGARLLRARIAESGATVTGNARDTVWYGGEQACNVSLSQDSAKKTLFLDFGGRTGQEFVGESYRTHERILVADSTGKLIQSVAAPDGYTFDHAEWVHGRSDLAVATLSNSNGSHERIVLVKMDDGKVVDLVEGDDLWHPNFWAYTPMNFSKFKVEPDSAGVYMKADDDVGAVLMRFNMELIWRYRDTANVVVVGSSRPLNSVSPWSLDREFFAVNLAQTPNSIYTSRDILNLYVYKHFKKLKYIIISLDIDFWYKIDGPGGDNFFATRYADYPGYVYDMNHGYWESGYPEGLLEYTENYLTVSDEPNFVRDRGRLLGINCRSWGEDVEAEMDSTLYDNQQYLLDDNMTALEGIIKKAQEHDVNVVGVIFPQSPAFKKTGAFGRYGLRRSVAKKLIEKFEKLDEAYPNFKFMDENKMGDHDYPDGYAADTDHLCFLGATIMTRRINAVLKTFE